MNYSDKLKDPRWQKKRLEVFQRDGWKCVVTGFDRYTLHVHHKRYVGNPWDSPLEDLETVCEQVHDLIEKPARRLRKLLPNASFSALQIFTAIGKAIERVPDDAGYPQFDLEFLKEIHDYLGML